MKENINQLTGIFIIVSIAVLGYLNYDREVITQEVEDIEEVNDNLDTIEIPESVVVPAVFVPEIEMMEIMLTELKATIRPYKIVGKINWPKNREAKFYLKDTTITAYVNWSGKFEAEIPGNYEGYITFHHGDETTNMYISEAALKDIPLTINTKEFDETINYGDASSESSYLAWKFLYQEESSISPDVYNSTAEELSATFDSLFQPMLEKLDEFYTDTNLVDSLKNVSLDLDEEMDKLWESDLDSSWSDEVNEILEKQIYINQIISKLVFYNAEIEWMNKIKNYYLKRHEQVQNVPKAGEAAIDFTYPDMDSNMVSLSDFIGSYVYVDIWATWCGPCKYEIPFLIQLEKDYHDANIVFISISTDVEDKRQVWIDMIKNMGGVQLISTDGWKSKICQDYAINGIPRFMLFDTEGNVVSSNAARPSSEEIRETFDGFVLDQEVEDEMSGMTEADPPAGEE